jgi:AcrR family transcriptional regulator
VNTLQPLRKNGRPTRDAADRLTAHVVACAARLFLRNGYAGASIEALAAEAGVGKNTIYRRYATKSDLFQAVVDHQMQIVLPPPDTAAGADEDLTAGLRRIAALLVKAALDPETTALQRLIIAETERFPELSAICLDRAFSPAIAIARAVLKGSAAPGTDAKALDFAAEQFIANMVYGPHLHALMGHRALGSSDEIARYVDNALALFLNGWKPAD